MKERAGVLMPQSILRRVRIPSRAPRFHCGRAVNCLLQYSAFFHNRFTTSVRQRTFYTQSARFLMKKNVIKITVRLRYLKVVTNIVVYVYT